jgi:hypothetical protein
LRSIPNEKPACHSECGFFLSGRLDSNQRSPDPQSGAITKLRYGPTHQLPALSGVDSALLLSSRRGDRIKFCDEAPGGYFVPGLSERSASGRGARCLEPHVRAAATTPTAWHGRENPRLGAHEGFLLLQSEQHDASALFGPQRREDLAAHAKVWVTHMRALGNLGQTKRDTPEVLGGYSHARLFFAVEVVKGIGADEPALG